MKKLLGRYLHAALAGGKYLLVFAFPLISSVNAEDLSAVVGEALASNPDVLEAESVLAARGEEYRGARAGYRPSVELNAGIGHEYTDSPSTRSGGDHSDDLTRKELGLNLRQMLFDADGTTNEIARQAARRDSAASRLRSVAESVAMQTAEAYTDVARFESLKSISAESLQVHQRIEDQIRLRSESGVGRRADYEQILARVALAQANLIAADVNVRDAHTSFQRVVGRSPGVGYVMPEAAPGALPASLDEALELARGANPVIAVADADVLAARSQHAAAKQFNYPRFDIEIGGNLNDNIDGAAGYNNDLTAMLRMRYNLYRGGADRARIRETAHNINESKEIRHRSLRQLEESVRLAWAAYEATAAQVPLLEKQVVAAAATRDAYIKQFNISQRTLLDVLNSENDALQARQAVVNANADHLLAQYRILEAMGRLLPHFGLQPAKLVAN